ncbi:LacI family DNA-binding transcriptional regulator [Agromyces sp. CFH 90414]|uniref:LacI family DNA-binding transcriptional regulator n=1 Tax=Agromyces agglutinans TaxID=2662258 RepID=A0A6I2FA89_9MICO|nr:LacI family DNA-binding transcriptional regulator [Agromyces agglutinans]MRG61164.1 LacI family DNA-binding transcriptional regulator [Agromyces agglutinans]
MASTLHDVARLAGVSIKTVSNVINDYPHIRPATREKVEQAIAETGYRPNRAARLLRSGRTGLISLVMPDLRNVYFAELADDVMTAAAAHGLSVLIEQIRADQGPAGELEVVEAAIQRGVDGVLYSVLALRDEDVAELRRAPVPLVLLGERIFGGPTDHVTMQNVEAARAATEHLIERGSTRIAALGAHEGEVIGSAGLRLRGYREALEAAGLPFDERLVPPGGTWFRSDGARLMRQILDSGVEFDAVFAFNDAVALGAMRVLQEAGLRVPHDVRIIGFDDLDETRYTMPTLSTIDPGRRLIAETAVEFLVERINAGEGGPAPREVEVPFRVVERESTAIG